MSRTRLVRRGVVCVGVATFGVAVTFASAGASQEADQQGWWSATTVAAGPPVVPPDVPPDGLLVQGGTGEPSAFAALVYRFAPGARATRMRLEVVAGSGTTPGATLQLCPLTSPVITAEQGGPMERAPDYDCSDPVEAAADEGGTTYDFPVGPLLGEDALAVAILPGAPTDRVVLAHPAAEAVTVEASEAMDGTEAVGGFEAGAGSEFGVGSDFTGPGATPSVSPPAELEEPTMADVADTPSPQAALTSSAPPLTEAAPGAARAPATRRAWLLAVTVLAGIGLWKLAGDAEAEPVSGAPAS